MSPKYPFYIIDTGCMGTMKIFLTATCLLLADAQDGHCLAGLDPLEIEQSCLSKCRIYAAGEHGNCNSYQVTAQDVDGPCGSTVETACISHFNGEWDPLWLNCGKCYLVEMVYDDGTVRSTFIKTIGTSASETKFEMSQIAWTNLCPYVCKGDGACTYDPDTCILGPDPDDEPIPAPCYVQNAPVIFTRVDCDGARDDVPEVTMPSFVLGESEIGLSENVLQCQSIIHNDVDPDWDQGCKHLCDYYAGQHKHCPQLSIGTELALCVHRLHPYCAV
eukprot:Blabericola_migrator_1__4989@NODE_2592_length_2562_cov_294_162325_g1624_i0_p1_GENE_NODE_2592_length_2562_cov_294_162325_g1624_i0NODE_2592_length_2562_cov_294_162325_g1624_i0_p1_ORF_typecomplete_len275_score22_00DUF4803/PF16061_5/1_4e02DUF4803/PF16061_5/0_37_NODE_2592_length_2562_cov_294_162325_g1624_i04111235